MFAYLSLDIFHSFILKSHLLFVSFHPSTSDIVADRMQNMGFAVRPGLDPGAVCLWAVE